VGATCIVSAHACSVLGWIQGFETSNITFVSSKANPPCSASFFVLPEYVCPMFGCTMRSGVRESPLGGIPGALNIVVSVLPTKISSMANSLADCWRLATAEAVEHEDVNQMSEMSSSVGPMPVA